MTVEIVYDEDLRHH